MILLLNSGHPRRVHNRFGGMWDLAIFCGDTLDANLGTSIMSRSEISYFYEVGM